jgi:hypothetical protein
VAKSARTNMAANRFNFTGDLRVLGM